MSEAATHLRANIQWIVNSATKDYRAEVPGFDCIKMFVFKAEALTAPTNLDTTIYGIPTEIHEQITPHKMYYWM